MKCNFVRFGIYFNIVIKICFKYWIFLENVNIGHMKISRDYFWPPKFVKKMDNISIILFVYTFENVLIC